MAKHIVLLFFFVCRGEGNGLSGSVGPLEEDQNLQGATSKRQQVLPRTESVKNSVFLERVTQLGSHVQNVKNDRGALPNVAFNLNDREPHKFVFEGNLEGQSVILKHPESPAKSLIPKHNHELTVNHENSSNLTNGEVEGVINDHSGARSSDEEYALRLELHLETGVNVLPERTQEQSKWVTESDGSQSRLHLLKQGPGSRRRRSWLWNQFFVIEEYRGPEPVLIGRVSCRFFLYTHVKDLQYFWSPVFRVMNLNLHRHTSNRPGGVTTQKAPEGF